MPTPLMPDITELQRKLANFKVATYKPGEAVLTAGSTTGRLLILKNGCVAVTRKGIEIAKVREPGAVFGELSVLLDQPHTADVTAIERSEFHVADAASLLRVEPFALLYVAKVLARRLYSANQALIKLKRQLQVNETRSAIEKMVEQIEELMLLDASGARNSEK